MLNPADGIPLAREAKERIERYVTEAERDGATVLLSRLGVGDIPDHGSIEFRTRTRKTTTKWKEPG